MLSPLPSSRPPSTRDSAAHDELSHQIAELNQQVQTLRDVLDDIHDSIQWILRNGLPLAPPVAEQWTMFREAGTADAVPFEVSADFHELKGVEAPSIHCGFPSPPLGKLFLKPGDQGRLF
jgi:hypothetical protein